MIKRYEVGPRLSEMAIHNGTVYLAGQVAGDAALDIRGQMRQVLDAVDRLLATAGSSKANILMAQIFISDLADLDGMNEVWDAWVEPGHSPPRATVQAKLARPGWRVEVIITATVN